MAFLLPIAFGLVILAAVAVQGSAVDAAEKIANGSELWPEYAYSGDDELFGGDSAEVFPDTVVGPLEPERVSAAAPEFEGLYADGGRCWPAVWSASMTVGQAADSTTTYTGYVPSLTPPVGGLDDTGFTHHGVRSSVQNIFQQEFAESVYQFVLNTDVRLPSDLVLKVGSDRFFVDDSEALGADNSIRVWPLESGMGWTEGETKRVRLAESPFRLPQTDISNLESLGSTG